MVVGGDVYKADKRFMNMIYHACVPYRIYIAKK